MGSNEKRRRRFVKQSISILAGILALLGVLFYARNLEQHQSHFFVQFKKPSGELTGEFKLEIADDEAERNKGLMFRKEMPSDEGMIFIYPHEQIQTFWMKNTYLSLDMVFVDSNWKVVGILEKVPPLNQEMRRVDKQSQNVIELLAGTAKSAGIEVGSEVIYSGQPPKAMDRQG